MGKPFLEKIEKFEEEKKILKKKEISKNVTDRQLLLYINHYHYHHHYHHNHHYYHHFHAGDDLPGSLGLSCSPSRNLTPSFNSSGKEEIENRDGDAGDDIYIMVECLSVTFFLIFSENFSPPMGTNASAWPSLIPTHMDEENLHEDRSSHSNHG